jgi:hypothetical protein
MNSSAMSRRHWIGSGLATCGYLAAAQCQSLAGETSLVGYTMPGPVTRRLLSPFFHLPSSILVNRLHPEPKAEDEGRQGGRAGLGYGAI